MRPHEVVDADADADSVLLARQLLKNVIAAEKAANAAFLSKVKAEEDAKTAVDNAKISADAADKAFHDARTEFDAKTNAKRKAEKASGKSFADFYDSLSMARAKERAAELAHAASNEEISDHASGSSDFNSEIDAVDASRNRSAHSVVSHAQVKALRVALSAAIEADHHARNAASTASHAAKAASDAAKSAQMAAESANIAAEKTRIAADKIQKAKDNADALTELLANMTIDTNYYLNERKAHEQNASMRANVALAAAKVSVAVNAHPTGSLRSSPPARPNRLHKLVKRVMQTFRHGRSEQTMPAKAEEVATSTTTTIQQSLNTDNSVSKEGIKHHRKKHAYVIESAIAATTPTVEEAAPVMKSTLRMSR